VLLVDRDLPGATALAKEVGGVALVADVTDGEAAEGAGDLLDGIGPIRALVCCAGLQRGARVIGRGGCVDLGWFRQSVEVNLVGTFNWVRVAAERMAAAEPDRDGGRGVIVTTSSITAWDGVDGGVAYAAAKAGVAGMTLPLARDLAPWGIRVVSIAPGTFATPMIDTMPGAYADRLRGQIPFPPRFGRPEEFAELVATILRTPYLNGEVIRLDGGLRMPPSRSTPS
jgi:NAD(P)-dependent dehydrogenase (short-subunit alcohol dehydrogenase family)